MNNEGKTFPVEKTCNENCPQHYHLVLFNPQSAGNYGTENLFFNFCERKACPETDPLNYRRPYITLSLEINSSLCNIVACESIRFSFALRRWGRFAKRPQRRRAKEKRMLSQASNIASLKFWEEIQQMKWTNNFNNLFQKL